jgi:MFS family permease
MLLRFHRILFTAAFMLSLAVGIVNFALIFYVQDFFSADRAAIGLISSAQALSYFLGLVAFLSWKRPHPRHVLWLSSWSMAGCILVYLIAPTWIITFMFHSLFGLALSLFWPRIMGWLSWGLEGRDLGTTMGKFNLSWSSGGILAPYLGGLLVELDRRLPFLASVLLLLAVGLLMPIGSRIYAGFKDRQSPQVNQEEAGAREPAGSGPGRHSGPSALRYPVRVAIVSTYFLSGAILFIFPAYAKEHLGYAESLIGSFLLVRMAISSLGFSLWGRWTFWHFRFWPLVLVTVMFIILGLAFPLADQIWQFFALFAAFGLALSFLYSSALFHGAAGSRNRERSMSIHEGAINLGLFSGMILGGWISVAWSMDAVFYLSAAATAVLLLVQTGLYLRNR